MRVALQAVKLDVARGNVIEAEVHEPGIARLLFIHLEPESLILARAGEQPKMRVWPCLLFEVNPDAPKRRRRFVCSTPALILDTTELGGELAFVQAIQNPHDGGVFVVFEARAEVQLELQRAAPRNGIAPE